MRVQSVSRSVVATIAVMFLMCGYVQFPATVCGGGRGRVAGAGADDHGDGEGWFGVDGGSGDLGSGAGGVHVSVER